MAGRVIWSPASTLPYVEKMHTKVIFYFSPLWIFKGNLGMALPYVEKSMLVIVTLHYSVFLVHPAKAKTISPACSLKIKFEICSILIL